MMRSFFSSLKKKGIKRLFDLYILSEIPFSNLQNLDLHGMKDENLQ